MTFGSVLFQLLIQPILYLIETSFLLFNEVFNNIGIAVVGVSFVVSIFCLPLYMIAEKWQEAERNTQLKLKNGITRIKHTFKGDEQYMILSTFYKQNHYHPLMALRSSFSLLIQIPFFIAAYSYLSNLELLHGYSFLFIKDFGLPDSTFKIGNFPINVLPIAMTLINCISSAIYSKGHDIKEKIQIYSCALIFLVLLYNSPSGLVVYWTMNNVFSLIKNVFYKIKNPKKVLYIISCIVSALLLILPFTLFSSKKQIIKLFLLCCGLLIPLLPFLLRKLNVLFSKNFSTLDTNSKVQFLCFLFSIIGITLIVGYVIPTMLISSEPDNFCYVDNYKSPFIFVIQPLLQSIGLFTIWPICIYFLFSQKTKKVLTFLFSIIFYYAIINTFLFSGKYGPLEQNLMFMTAQSFFPNIKQLLLNLFILFCLITILFLLFNRFPSIIKNINYIVVFTLFFIGTFNTFSIKKTFCSLPEPQMMTKIESVYHLSKTEPNVIILMQDRCFMPYVDEIIQSDSELKKQFEGFTFYPNTTSFGHLTMVGSPGIFGGYDYTPFEINKNTDKTLQQKHNEALLTLPVLFNQAGYDVTVSNLPYENYLEAPYSQIYDNYPFIKRINTHEVYSDFWYKEKGINHEKHMATEIKRNIFWFGLFKIVPPVLRAVIYHNNYWNSIDFSSNRQELFVNTYTPIYYSKQLTDFSNTKPSFLLIDNEMTHRSLCLNAPDYLLETSSDTEAYPEQTRQAQFPTMINLFRNYGSFFDYLRKNDVYNNTRIIIVSDHGMCEKSELFSEHEIGSMIKEQFVATLLVKDFNSSDEYKIDNTFMTNADTPYLALSSIIENPKNPFTHNFLKVQNKEDYTKLTMGPSESTQNRKHTQFKIKSNEWAYVKDDIFNNSNWKILSPEEIE